MNKRLTIGLLIILIFIIVGFFTILDNKTEYTNFQSASLNHKKCQVKGTWIRDKETRYDAKLNRFIFYMKDDNDSEMKVILEGAKPNNFEMAENVVAKGRVKDGYFLASDVLTKCPSKYEGKGEDVKKSGM